MKYDLNHWWNGIDKGKLKY